MTAAPARSVDARAPTRAPGSGPADARTADTRNGRPADTGGTEVRRPGRLGYLPALDGLRALAVVAVLLYHLGFGFLPGGYLGVDLFFVISGFLITALLVDEARRTNRIRIAAFWLRRGRRLLPALVLMVVTVAAVTTLVGRDLDAGLRTQVFGAAVYGSNWFQIGSGASYVERYEPQVFTHLWSLAVEEQFYLIWPFAVILLLSFLITRRARVGTVLALAAASAIWMVILFVPGADPTRVYVGTDTHGFALLLGAALGLGLRLDRPGARPGRSPGGRDRLATLGVLGCLVVLTGMVVLDDHSAAAFRGGIVLVDVAAVALVAAAARRAGPVGSVFAVPLLTWIGRRSYGIYLWHWPLIVMLGRVLPWDAPGWVTTGLVVLGTVTLAQLSYRYVETPIRTRGFAGAVRHLGAVVGGRVPGRPGHRGWGLAGATGLTVAAVVATIGLVVAPTRSALADQLAAGEAALSQLSATKQRSAGPGAAAPGSPTSTPVKPVPALPIPQVVEPGVSSTQSSPVPVTTQPVPVTTQPPARRGTARPPAGGTSPGGARSTRSAKPAGTATGSPSSAPSTRTSSKAAPSTQKAVSPSTRKPAPPPQLPSAGPITAVGDSVMLGAAPDLLAAFPDIDIDAKVSRQWWDLPAAVAQHVRDGAGATVVIGLGTNGTWSAAEIQAALGPLGNRPVVLVNSYVQRSWAEDVNAQIAAVARSRPHTCVADWHALAAAHKDWIGYDGVHPDQAGRQGYAALLVQTVNACH